MMICLFNLCDEKRQLFIHNSINEQSASQISAGTNTSVYAIKLQELAKEYAGDDV